jgi:poly(3-hydroxybutyrate) depolymerase
LGRHPECRHPTDQNKAAPVEAGKQVGRQASRQVATVKKEGKEMDGCSQQPTDRPGPTHKTTASQLLISIIFIIQLARLTPE